MGETLEKIYQIWRHSLHGPLCAPATWKSYILGPKMRPTPSLANSSCEMKQLQRLSLRTWLPPASGELACAGQPSRPQWRLRKSSESRRSRAPPPPGSGELGRTEGVGGNQRPQVGEEHKGPVRKRTGLRSHHSSWRPCFGHRFWKGLKCPGVVAQARAAPAPNQVPRLSSSGPDWEATAPAPKGGVTGPAGQMSTTEMTPFFLVSEREPPWPSSSYPRAFFPLVQGSGLSGLDGDKVQVPIPLLRPARTLCFLEGCIRNQESDSRDL